MLVISRKREEEVVITCLDGTRIVLTCCDIRGDKVRFGVEAPREYGVHRKEVQDAIDREDSLRLQNAGLDLVAN